LSRPAHIHIRVSGTAEQDLVTQIYFKGDKNIPTDMSASDPKSLNRILEISKNAKNEKTIKFDFVLKDAYLLDKAAYKKISGLYQMSDKSMGEFYQNGNELFLKVNGQIMEAMEYKGNNSFEGGLGQIKAQFELKEEGKVKVKISYEDDNKKTINIEGEKLLKYS
jgi:hypothetical protein